MLRGLNHPFKMAPIQNEYNMCAEMLPGWIKCYNLPIQNGHHSK